MTPANSSIATVLTSVFASALIAGVAHAQPTPVVGGGTGAGGSADPDAGGEIVDVPIIPVEEPTPATEAPQPDSPVLAVSYDKGIVFTNTDDTFEAKLTLRSQTRLEISRPTEDGAEFSSHFVIPRLRLQLEGHVFGKDTRYKLEAGLEERGSFSFVKDFFVEHKAGPVWIRGGQWKRPFNRQELVSDFGSEFNERAITAEFVGGGRDLGLAVHNDYEKSPEGVEWVVGVFNGFSGGNDRPKITTTCTQDPVDMTITCTNGNAANFPTDFTPAAVVRVGYNKGKVKGYSEADLDGGPLRFGVGVSYKVDLANFDKPVGDNVSHGLGLDAIIKVAGFDVQVGGFMMKLKTADARFGAMAQAGYFVVPKKIQVGLRGAFHQLPGTKVKEMEVRGAFNYHFNGHAWKIASDAGILKETGGGKPEVQLRSMAQLTF